ncbi:MAG: hypothetical protein AB1585_11045, partial [Thermodesulfobacteriota bacterium]
TIGRKKILFSVILDRKGKRRFDLIGNSWRPERALGQGRSWLARELGISKAEIARQVGVGTTGVAMAVKGMEEANKTD